MKIIIFSPTSTVFSLQPDQLLGGADSGLLKMIEILARDHEVEAYIPIKEDDQGSFKGAMTFPFMDMLNSPKECDLFIHYRKLWAIPSNVKYKKAVFYSQDTADTPCFAGIKDRSKALSPYARVWVLSNFHKNNIQKVFPESDDKFFILGNGADPQDLVEKTPLSFIYSSTPFRGLDVLLKLWKSIIVKYPTATLHVFSSMKIYGAENLDDLYFSKMYGDLKNNRYKGVIYHGSQPQRIVLDQMKKTFMLLYPNVYPETYCNVVMESRACHTPFITTDLGALRETGNSGGAFIDGSARDPQYQEKFLKTLDLIISDPKIYAEMQKACYPIRTFEDYAKDLLSEINRLNEIKEIKD
jgi:glycosyltransferase involved in cell wall biosynthesis